MSDGSDAWPPGPRSSRLGGAAWATSAATALADILIDNARLGRVPGARLIAHAELLRDVLLGLPAHSDAAHATVDQAAAAGRALFAVDGVRTRLADLAIVEGCVPASALAEADHAYELVAMALGISF